MAGIAVTFLSVLVAANLLAGRPTRRLRTIRSHAELLPLMPDGSAKARLEEAVNNLVHDHLTELRLDAASAWLRVALAIRYLVVGLVGVGFVATLLWEAGVWRPVASLLPFQWLILVALVVVAVVYRVTLMRVRKSMGAFERLEQAGD